MNFIPVKGKNFIPYKGKNLSEFYSCKFKNKVYSGMFNVETGMEYLL